MRGAVGILIGLGLVMATGCRADETLGGDFPGPPCNCDSYFPLCVGARWTYQVFDPATGADLGQKTMTIVDFEERSEDSQLAPFKDLFIQERQTPLDWKRSWLVHDGQQIVWLKDLWYARADGSLNVSKYFRPGKTRFDESHAADGDRWAESYEEDKTEYPNPPGPTNVYSHAVDWSTSYQMTPGGWNDALCQHKFDMSSEGGGLLTNASYCFVQGVGKVYELTLAETDERLVDYSIPGCQ